MGEKTHSSETRENTGLIYQSGPMAISGAGVGTCLHRGLANASLTKVWCIQAQTSMEPFPNSRGLEEIFHNKNHGRVFNLGISAPPCSAWSAFLLARVGGIDGTDADAVQKQLLSGHLLLSLKI